ncbi:lysostaphin resistance A-like protein [Streptococcus tangpeifui]|uniref:CPBP family intramembrane glutamic endopeptidase n=1 Tax=Streptococcus tangpeifui TaxID=2709400 RepID=UPI0013EDE915|nr:MULTISPECIES: CPBP family intramembrane glutamic endopeptidase [unclassified Streptococcus]
MKVFLEKLKWIGLAIGLSLAEQAGMLVISFAAVVKTVAKYGRQADPNHLLPAGPVGVGLAVLVELGALALAVWLLYRWDFIKKKRLNWKILVFGLILAYVLVTGIEQVASFIMQLEDKTNTSNQQAVESMLSYVPAFFMIIAVAITAPVIEELIFRGFIQQKLFRNPWLGYLFGSLAFGLAHTPDSWGAALAYIGMGAVIGFFAFKYKRLEYGIVLHILNNFISVLIMYQMISLPW